MDPLTLGAVAGGVKLVGNVLGGLFGSGDRKKAENLANEAYEYAMSIGAPPELAREILLETFKQEGMYVPEMEEAVDLAMSEVAQIKEDPGLRDSQMKALSILGERADSGLNAEDRAALAEIQNEVAAGARGQEQAIIQDMQQRGMGGSGAELAARLSSAQSAANTASQGGLDVAAQASRNALEAARMYGDLSGNVRSQDFNTAQTMAEAKDLRNRMLYDNSVALQQRNVGRANEAAQSNLARRQQVADANVDQANRELYRQRDAEGSDWRNQLATDQFKIDQMNTRAGQYSGKAKDTANRWSAGAGALADAGTALAKGGLFDGDDDYVEAPELGKKATLPGKRVY